VTHLLSLAAVLACASVAGAWVVPIVGLFLFLEVLDRLAGAAVHVPQPPKDAS
jgi:hypothetical protein